MLHVIFLYFVVLRMSHYICDQLLNLMGIHLFHYAHGGERTTSYNVVRDVFMAIARNVGFHVL